MSFGFLPQPGILRQRYVDTDNALDQIPCTLRMDSAASIVQVLREVFCVTGDSNI